MMPLPEILSRFRKCRPVKSRPDCWKACCPIHKGGEERNPSLWLHLGDKWLNCKCYACNAPWQAIIQAVGLTMNDVAKEKRTNDEAFAKRKVAKEYVYTDEFGKPLYKVCRWEPKAFHQERWDEETQKWRPGLGDCRRVLYRLTDLLSPRFQGWPVIVVEGEKDVDRLFSLGLLATCNVGGCGMGWQMHYGDWFKDRRVTVIPDNDGPGQQHAENVAGSILFHGLAASVRIATLCLTDGSQWLHVKDVSDYLDRGGTKEGLLEQIKAHTEWVPQRAADGSLDKARERKAA